MYFLRSTLTAFLLQLVLIESQVMAFMFQMQNMNVALKDTIRAVKIELNHIIELMHNLNSTFGDSINYKEVDIAVSTIRNSVQNVKEVKVVIPLQVNTSQPAQKHKSLGSLLGTPQYFFKALDETPVQALNEVSVTMKPDVIRKRNSSAPIETNYINFTKVSIPRMSIRSQHEIEKKTTMEPWNLDNLLGNLFNPKTTASSNKTQMGTHRSENTSILYSLSDYIPKKGLNALTIPDMKTRTYLADGLCQSEKCGGGMMTRSKLNRPAKTRYASPFSQYNPLYSLFLRNSLDLRNPKFNLSFVKQSTTLPPVEEDLYKFIMYYT